MSKPGDQDPSKQELIEAISEELAKRGYATTQKVGESIKEELAPLEVQVGKLENDLQTIEVRAAHARQAFKDLDEALGLEGSSGTTTGARLAHWLGRTLSVLVLGVLILQVWILQKQLDRETQSDYDTRKTGHLELIYGNCGNSEGVPHGCEPPTPPAVRRSALVSLLDLERRMPESAWGQRSLVDRGTQDRIDLKYAPLAGIDLDGIDLRSVNLSQADLPGQNLTSAKLGNTWFLAASMHGVVLSRSDKPYSDISFSGANLSSAILSTAQFLENVDMTNTVLENAQLSGADLSGVKGLTTDQICSGRWDAGQHPKLPAYLMRSPPWCYPIDELVWTAFDSELVPSKG
ncbi:MAG: pentapeptide repeat-containing protein [Acidobacteriota bacterium]